MSNIASELTLLRQKIEMLEKQKMAEDEMKAAKEADPLATLGQIIEAKKEQISRNRRKDRFDYMIYYSDNEKVAMLEPIINMLKDIQQRLTVLEQERS